MTLEKYRQRRDFRISPEPRGTNAKSKARALLYVIQKHRASRLHYDFRLEHNGALLSWAIPKGPSLDPSVKRLAMQVEDHPVEYGSFEGVIPEGEYGGGTVMLWDSGTWVPEGSDVDQALQTGDLKFTLNGEKLHGSWALVRTRGFGSSKNPSWLLIKHRDQFASKKDVTLEMPKSVSTGRLLKQIASAGGGDVDKAASGDPSAPARPRKNKRGRRLT
jgi:bifunctional non-homologous end joining protein LigD